MRSAPGLHRDRLDARAAGRIQLLLRHRLGERGAHEVADDLAVHLLAVLLADHRERRLARAKALEARRARDLVEPLRDFAVDLRRGDRHFEAALETAGGGQRNLHINSLSIVDHAGEWCERRDSNSHGLPHWNLNPARLPVPPLSLKSPCPIRSKRLPTREGRGL